MIWSTFNLIYQNIKQTLKYIIDYMTTIKHKNITIKPVIIDKTGYKKMA